jgi:hypothetical protein
VLADTTPSPGLIPAQSVVFLSLLCAMQYLCCEVAHMQQHGQLYPLQVLDVAHMAWRLQVACEVEATAHAHDEVWLRSLVG